MINLLFELNSSLFIADRTVASGLVQRITGFETGEQLGRAVEEFLSDRLDENDPLGRNTDLTCGMQFAELESLDGCIHVGVFEHDEWINSAKFHDGLLHIAAGLLGNCCPAFVTAREGHALHTIVVDNASRVPCRQLQVRVDTFRNTGVLEKLVERFSTLRYV